MILDSSLKVCFVMLENFCTFVMYYILEGRETCQSLTGIFMLVHSIYGGFVSPCGVLMHPLPSRCSTTGRAEPSFLFASTKFFTMKTEMKNI